MAGVLASQLGLLLAVLTLGALVLSLARQIGVLHERTAPGGLPHRARRLGRLDLDTVQAATLAGEAGPLRHFVGAGGSALLFVSEACALCKSLLPKLPVLLETVGAYPLVVGEGASRAGLARLAEEHGLRPEHILISPQLAVALQVLQTPTLVLLSDAGQVLERVRLRGARHLERVLAEWDSTGD